MGLVQNPRGRGLSLFAKMGWATAAEFIARGGTVLLRGQSTRLIDYARKRRYKRVNECNGWRDGEGQEAHYGLLSRLNGAARQLGTWYRGAARGCHALPQRPAGGPAVERGAAVRKGAVLYRVG
jgi:hypothetical protein